MKDGKRLVVPGLFNKVAVQAERVTPRRFVTAVIKRLQQSRG
jgi:short-subunit dehydrogenase